MNEDAVHDTHKKPKKYSPRKSRTQRRFNNWREKNDWEPYTMEGALAALKLGNYDLVVEELLEEVTSRLNGDGDTSETIQVAELVVMEVAL